MEIDGRTISSEHPPYVIAEISANHEGDLERALKTIKAAKMSGASAVKIQTYTADTMTLDCDSEDFKISHGLWEGKTLYQLYAEAHTPFEWHDTMFQFARNLGITLFSSPFDESAVELLESLQAPAYKIASFEIVDLPLIAHVAQTKKPMLISTGMASYQEIGEALEVAKQNGCRDVAIFHCISGYPTPVEQANLKAITSLKNEFQVEVGLSDHTLGNLAAIVATSLGVTIIEKHFTLNRSSKSPDSEFSVEPDEMESLINNSTAAFYSMGDGTPARSPAEKGNLIFRRSLYFTADIKRGETITPNHIGRIRPGFGLPAKYFGNVVGQPAKLHAKRGDRVTIDHVDI